MCEGRARIRVVNSEAPNMRFTREARMTAGKLHNIMNEIRRAEYAIAKSDEYTEWFPKGNYGYPRYSGTN